VESIVHMFICFKDELEASVPSSTISPGNTSTSVNSHTTMCARALRVLLESLDDLRGARAQLVQRAQYAAEADDITTRIIKQAAGIERWTEVQPSMFEDTLDQELSKYDKYKSDLEDGKREQEKLLDEIEV
jgi:programmed cell death 6-interacting protein